MGSAQTKLVGMPAIALAVAALTWAVPSAQARPGDADCGCMDVALVIDDTGSMGGAISNVKAGLVSIIAAARRASGGDLRMGLVSFKDNVDVDQPFTGSQATITAAVNGLSAGGGAGLPESSDEALLYTVTGATACALVGSPPLGSFRADCLKIAILVTDALPGGCDDVFTAGVDDVNAAAAATAAAGGGVLVSAIFVPTGGNNPAIAAIMQNYATTTGGFYARVASNGTGTADAIQTIIEECGSELITDIDIKPGSCPNSYNRNSHGVLPVALLGTDNFDVTDVNLDSLLLVRKDGEAGSVAPNDGPPGPSPTIEDVATPFSGEEQCDCHEETGDGIDDLVLHFVTDDVVANLELNDFPSGASVSLTLVGELNDGTAFEGDDCVRLVPPGTPPGLLAVASTVPGAWIDLSPPDDTIDEGGFAFFVRSYPLSTQVTITAPPAQLGHEFVGWRFVTFGFGSSGSTPSGFDSLIHRETITLRIDSAFELIEAVYEPTFVPEPGDEPDVSEPDDGGSSTPGDGWGSTPQ